MALSGCMYGDMNKRSIEHFSDDAEMYCKATLICIANSDRKYLPVFDAADIHFAVTVSDAVGVGGQR